MLNINKFLPLTICIVIASHLVYGQVAKSPFSYLGIGEYYGNSLVNNQGMAEVGVSNPQYFFLNNQNPALLVFNRFTVFQAGLIGEQIKAKGNGVSQKNGDGNLNYLVTAFPVKMGKWSTSVGLMPYSSVNYKFNYTELINGTTNNTVDIAELGSGGVNQLYWSNGVALHKYFSIGLKATYLFGSVKNEYNSTLTATDQLYSYSTNITERNYIKGGNLSAGFSLHIDSIGGKKNYKFNLGGVFDLQSKPKTELLTSFNRNNSSGTINTDTLINNAPGAMTLPSSFTTGISFSKGEAWLVGFDFKYIDYTKYKDRYTTNPVWATQGMKMGLGTEFTPDPTALSSYIKRIIYRTGVSYEKLPYLINGYPVKDFGINFGFSLPVSRISSLDVALKVGKRGNIQENTIMENYFKVYFGVTFNDNQWFIKRRFD